MVAPLDRVKILFQTSNPDFQKYAGVLHFIPTDYRVNDIDRVQGHGGALTLPALKYTAKRASMDSSRGTQRLCCAFSLTPPSST